MTLKEAYQYGEHRLSENGISDARLDAWLLIEHVTGITRAMYYVKDDKELTEEEEDTLKEYIKKRATHVPLQHITGVQEFMGLEFRVNEHVLIPRQDTEILVEEALAALNMQPQLRTEMSRENEQSPSYRILDMCTGSGCILLSLLYHANQYGNIRCEGTGIDISEQALIIATSNAKSLCIQAQFLQSDLFQAVQGKYQMIVSNPPYIRTKEIESLQEEVKHHDPLLALDGKDDGLYFYRKIVTESSGFLERGGSLFFEIGFDQGDDVQSMMRVAGYKDVVVKKDLAGLDRVVIGVYDR